MEMNARQVVASHVRWKIALQFAIVMRENLSEEQHRQIRQPSLCPVGLWIDGPAAREYRLRPEYMAMRAAHLVFHEVMDRVAGMLERGQFQEASELIEEVDGEYAEASKRLAMSMMALDRLAPLRVSVP